MQFTYLKKSFPKTAKEFLVDQEVLASFFNLKSRDNLLNSLKINKTQKKKIMTVINHYAKLKIEIENKKNPQLRKEVIKIENDCLKKIFEARIIKMKLDDKKKAMSLAEKLLKMEFPGSVILPKEKFVMLARLVGTKGDTSDFLIFVPKERKVIVADTVIDRS